MQESVGPGLRRLLVGVGLVTALFAVILTFQVGGVRFADSWLDDLGELAAAATGSVACFVRGRRAEPGRRRPWLWFGLACGLWAAGQAVWTWYDLVLDVTVPFPSLADVGFLSACPATVVGALSFVPRRSEPNGRVRLLLDGVMVAGSLLFVSWLVVLGPTASSEQGDLLAEVVALLYPISDLITLTVLALVLMRCGARTRRTLVLLVVALGSLAVADSVFSYLTATNTYGAGSPFDAAWIGGWLLVAVAAVSDRSAPSDVADDRPRTLQLLLPYAIVLPPLVAALLRVATGHAIPDVIATEGLVVFIVAAVRQLLTMHQNAQLNETLHRTVAQLNEREGELRHLALHDGLTGLANRVGVAEAAEAALARAERSGSTTALLLCDIDRFKQVNDRDGHQAGDRLLCAVAARISALSRAGDVVGRIGGDEFLVLAEDVGAPADAEALAGRIVACCRDLVDGDGMVGVSVGVALCGPAGPSRYDELFRQADAALYRAKETGRGRWVRWVDHEEPVGADALG